SPASGSTRTGASGGATWVISSSSSAAAARPSSAREGNALPQLGHSAESSRLSASQSGQRMGRAAYHRGGARRTGKTRRPGRDPKRKSVGAIPHSGAGAPNAGGNGRSAARNAHA